MNKNTILRQDIEYNNWRYEVKQLKHIIQDIQNGSIPPQAAPVVYDEAIKDIKRFIWYALGEMYPL